MAIMEGQWEENKTTRGVPPMRQSKQLAVTKTFAKHRVVNISHVLFVTAS